MAFRLYSKMFLHVYLSRYRLFYVYYVAVPLEDDALEEVPNLYKGLISQMVFKFVDLGNFKPADGPPMQKLAM